MLWIVYGDIITDFVTYQFKMLVKLKNYFRYGTQIIEAVFVKNPNNDKTENTVIPKF